MKTIEDLMALHAKRISSVDTQSGYMQLLEYTLQDLSLVHVLQWHFIEETEVINDTLLPCQHVETFYNDKHSALRRAFQIGEELLMIR